MTGVDFVEPLLERGRERAAAEGLGVDFMEADTEALPCADASFDAVLSCVGVMFTPGHLRAARELVHVCRPGGTIALASWTPAGFVGRMFQTVARYVPARSMMWSPGLWGHRGAPAVPPRPCGNGLDVHAAGVRVPLPFSGGVGRRLPQLLQPGAQGVRLAGRVRPRAAVPGPRSACSPARSRARTVTCGAVGIPRGSCGPRVMSRAPVQTSRWLGQLGGLAPSGGVIRSLLCLVLAGAASQENGGQSR